MLMVMPASKLFLFGLFASCCFLLSDHVPHQVLATSTSPMGLDTSAPPISFSFDFSNRSSYRSDDLSFEGSATLDGLLVDLSCNSAGKATESCAGRMSYSHPVQFYDPATGEVASFSTRFNFKIGNPGQYAGDGMAFFLSSYPSKLPKNSAGGNLGLHSGDGVNAKGKNRIVAVEFDTYQNWFDPSPDHIGIDINTARASVSTTNISGAMNGSMTATITFNNSTRMLVASLDFDDQPSRGSYQVSAELQDPVKDLLPSHVAVGFSGATGSNFELHQIMSWSFNSTLPLKDNRIVIIGVAIGSVGAVMVVIFLVWIILSYYMWTRTRDSYAKGLTGLKRFEYSFLAAATKKFSSTLGEGGFGTVYKGSYMYKNVKQEVAVKKMKKAEGHDFIAELQTSSVTRHMNLVELKGWCCSRNRWNMIDFMCWCRQQRVKLFLVYELVPNGTLEDHLHNMDKTLPWEKRYGIVKGIGSAIRYLHHECNNKIILHRDIKPGNILLDNDFKAKLADFGLSKIVASKNKTAVFTVAIGTVGYMDPKCEKDGNVKFDRKSDVYSFGILLLEIACRKTREQVMERYGSSTEPGLVEAADEKLDGVFDKTQIERVIFLGLKCSDPDEKERPYMKDAMKFLEDGIELPAITGINVQQRAPRTVSYDESALLPSRLRS